jgi:hypothetical protein
MPKIDHPNIGEVVATNYYFGVIEEMYVGDDKGLCRVTLTLPDETVQVLDMVPIYFHCEPDAEERDNGSLEDGEAAFEKDDEVIVQIIGELSDVNS